MLKKISEYMIFFLNHLIPKKLEYQNVISIQCGQVIHFFSRVSIFQTWVIVCKYSIPCCETLCSKPKSRLLIIIGCIFLCSFGMTRRKRHVGGKFGQN